MEDGKTKLFEGHQGWILCLETYTSYREDGSVKSKWLLSGSDDKTIRIWDRETTKCLEILSSHKNGVNCLTFANNELFSGSMDKYIICWDVVEIENRIAEKQLM